MVYVPTTYQISPSSCHFYASSFYLCDIMSPRALMINGFDFFFYSMEEDRMHIHVEKGDNDAKFWLEPNIELVYNHGFTSKEIKIITKHIEEYERTIKDKWNYHFSKE